MINPRGTIAGKRVCETQLAAPGTGSSSSLASLENLPRRDNERVPRHGPGQMSCEQRQSGEFVVRSGWTFVKYRTLSDRRRY